MRLVISSLVALTAASMFSTTTGRAVAQDRPSRTVETGISVLRANASVPARAIPQSLFRDAEAVAVIPDMLKVGFVVAGRRGRGFVVVRREDGTWGNPIFVVLTGGSVGWQAGLQATDVVLVFTNQRSLKRVLDGGGKLTLGADVGVAAGPIGRQAAAATDDELRGEIFSYSRSRGLFAGIAIDGSVLEIDDEANSVFYGRDGVRPGEILTGQAIHIPPAADQLRAELGLLAPSERVPPPESLHEPTLVPLELVTRRNVARAWHNFAQRLDSRWTTYFAPPAELFQDGPSPPLQAVEEFVRRFDRVATDPQYQSVAALPHFQETRIALAEYARSLQAPVAPVGNPLPPPPPN